MLQEKPWPENIDYWNKITEKSADLAIAQSDLLLKESLTTAQSLRDKAEKVITLLIPSISALIIYIITGLSNLIDIPHLTAIVTIILMMVSLASLFVNIKPYAISVPGNDAETILNNDFINLEDTEREQYIQIALKVCSDNKHKRDKNVIANKTRADRNRFCLNLLAIGLPLSPILGFILYLLLCHHCL